MDKSRESNIEKLYDSCFYCHKQLELVFKDAKLMSSERCDCQDKNR